MKKILVCFIVLILVFLGLNYFSTKNKISRLSSDFERVNEYIVNKINPKEDISKLLLFDVISKFPALIRAKENLELCSINYSQEKYIYYKFRCKNNSYDNFFYSDDKFYLIKVLSNNPNKILSNEMFIDYAKKPISLKNNWYLIEQNIAYD